MVKLGQKAPEFALHDANGKERRLEEFRGKKVVLYFYPRDNTPGCTTEAIEFTKLKAEFERKNAFIIGISKDSCDSHAKFIQKQGLNILLLSDAAAQVQRLYGVWRAKSLIGQDLMGTVRSTFLIDEDGKILKIWDNVKAAGHAAEVLSYIKGM